MVAGGTEMDPLIHQSPKNLSSWHFDGVMSNPKTINFPHTASIACLTPSAFFPPVNTSSIYQYITMSGRLGLSVKTFAKALWAIVGECLYPQGSLFEGILYPLPSKNELSLITFLERNQGKLDYFFYKSGTTLSLPKFEAASTGYCFALVIFDESRGIEISEKIRDLGLSFSNHVISHSAHPMKHQTDPSGSQFPCSATQQIKP